MNPARALTVDELLQRLAQLPKHLPVKYLTTEVPVPVRDVDLQYAPSGLVTSKPYVLIS